MTIIDPIPTVKQRPAVCQQCGGRLQFHSISTTPLIGVQWLAYRLKLGWRFRANRYACGKGHFVDVVIENEQERR